MLPHPQSRRLEPESFFGRDLHARRGILDSWLPGESLNYTHGLTGVDQVGNYLWVDVLLYCFIGVGLATLLLRIYGMAQKHMRHLSGMTAGRNQGYWAVNQTTWWPWIQRHVLVAPLFHKRHNKGFQISAAIDNGTLPGRWHTIILILYFGSNIAYCLVLPWNNPESMSVAAALRGRSGTLAALNLIPTVLFALRNNPLIPLLQVSYDDFNLFHRWAARITILEAIVHTAAWMATVATGGTVADIGEALRVEESYTWGMVGTVCFIFIGIQAWSPLRHAFYETFLNIHKLMVILALVGVYLHLEKHGLPQIPWMHIVIGFWAFEYFFRLCRILYHSFSARKASTILVEAMPGEACRLTIDLVRPWQPRPGCHAHIYMPALALWSSHPFSIAWSPENSPIYSKEATLPTLEGETLTPCAAPTSKQISFICRARTGLTRKMYERAANRPDLAFTTFGLVEGPYGGHHSLDSYGTVLLFAGGVGITHQTMYLKHLINGHTNRTTCTQKIMLIWTIPESDCLEWVRPWMDEILRLPNRKKVLRIMLFITRPKRKIESLSESVRMIAGRPKIETLIDEEVKTRVGAMAVTVCGSGAFADDVRAAVRPRLEQGAIDFVEEAFTY
ncbi:hypothetical protein CC78DRAFT_209325 [Lojkania enalia]|uniref:FAD-binding FR-type domain-containing protein n=1 Tax=Lojkania enalia TaxID=147567 RepID=A0A9P4N6V8_9PLEO|nr:hypothetical protein CC78DRAFT_209325 [Didymosphaeria enalia]